MRPVFIFMASAGFGALVLAAAPVFAQQAQRNITIEDLSPEQAPMASFGEGEPKPGGLAISAWVDRADVTYKAGETVTLFVKANGDAYITVIDVGASGKAHVLFPNKVQPNSHIAAFEVVQIPALDERYRFTVGGPSGTELIKIIATSEPIDVIRPEDLVSAGAFRSFKRSAKDLSRDLSVTLDGKPRDFEVAVYNQYLRVLPDEASVTPKPPEKPTADSAYSADDYFRFAEDRYYGDLSEDGVRQALEWYRIAAEKGHVQAMYRIGRLYEAGEAPDLDKAEAWYRKASELGNTQAMVRLALLYGKGADGVEKDYDQAIAWLTKAAGAGDAVAMSYLAKMYDEGLGVAQDAKEAVRYLLDAVRAGVWMVQDSLPNMTETTRRELQIALKKAGFYNGTIDGRVGPETRSALTGYARA